jgi:hypothetical protein
MQDKISTLTTGIVGAISLNASNLAIMEQIADINVAELTQTIVNVLIGIITIYKLIKPKKKLDE